MENTRLLLKELKLKTTQIIIEQDKIGNEYKTIYRKNYSSISTYEVTEKIH